MATSVYVMGPEDEEPKRRSFAGRRKTAKGSGDSTTTTSSSGHQKKNKKPQRGMGVEKLEKLMVQENWKKMAHHLQNPAPDPIPIFGAPAAGAYLGFQYGQVDLFGAGKQITTNHHPLKSYSGQCCSCHKKKKINSGVADCGFLGLNNIGENQNVTRQENHQGLKFGTYMPPQEGHAEIVAVHRKGLSSSSSAEGHVMMEYEFFPTSCSSSSKSDSEDYHELLMMNLAETTHHPASSMTFNRSPSVDLSLKLSY